MEFEFSPKTMSKFVLTIHTTQLIKIDDLGVTYISISTPISATSSFKTVYVGKKYVLTSATFASENVTLKGGQKFT